MSIRTRSAHRARQTHDHTHHHLPDYPHDYLHEDRPWAETQRDIGGGLLLGALTLVTLMALIVWGLV